MNFLREKIINYFELDKNGTDIKTEVAAGFTTFMTMSYILIVHPNILSKAGMPVGPVTALTALTAGFFTLLLSLYTNLPFALAPAMGGNAFFAYTLVAGGVVTWQEGLGMVFISGVVFLVLTLLGLRELIVKMIPKGIKLSVGAAVGLYIAELGFSDAGLMDVSNGLLRLGEITPGVILAVIGFFLIATLRALNVKGALLFGILGTTIIGVPMGITEIPKTLVSIPPSIAPIAFKLDIFNVLKLSLFPMMFTFFMSDFFSTFGTLIGVSEKAGLLDEKGNLPGIEKPFLVDAVATIGGSLLGTTTITTFIESASGVDEGGRTGLTSLVTAICFFAMLFLTPVAAIIPSQATAPVLIIIGLLMMSSIINIDFNDFTEALPAFITITFAAFTFSLSNGISLGIIVYVFLKLITGRGKELHWGLYMICIPLIYYFINL